MSDRILSWSIHSACSGWNGSEGGIVAAIEYTTSAFRLEVLQRRVQRERPESEF